MAYAQTIASVGTVAGDTSTAPYLLDDGDMVDPLLVFDSDTVTTGATLGVEWRRRGPENVMGPWQQIHRQAVTASGAIAIPLDELISSQKFENAQLRISGAPAAAITIATTVAGDDNPATNEVQTVKIEGATGGTFTITYSGQTTAAIAYGATAAAVQAALEALSNLAPDDVVVTKTSDDLYTLTFGGTLAATNVDAVTATATGLTSNSGANWTDGTHVVTLAQRNRAA